MTDKFKQECKNSTYKNRLGRIETEDETISNFDNLASIEIVDSCISNGEVLGNTNAKTIKIDTLKDYNLVDKQINPFIGVKYDDTSEEYIKMGKYTITDETDDKTAQNGVYNGFDDLKKLDQVYVCGIEFTADTVITVLDFYKDVCRQIGLTPKKLSFINDDIPVSGNPFTNNETCRIVLQNIAQVFCTFADIDWETNKIDLIWFDKHVTETFTKKDYSTLEKNQVFGPINSLVIKESAIDGENVTREQASKDIISLEFEGKSEQETAPSIESSTEIKTVHGLQNLLELSSNTTNGITSKLNDDGSLNISGTTDTTWANITSTINKSILPGTYVFSVTKTYSFDIAIRLTYLDDTYEDFYIAKGFLKKVLEISKQASNYYVYISALSSGTSIDEDLYIQLEKGSVANEFVPYGNWLKVKNIGFSMENGQNSTEYESYKEQSILVDMNSYDTLENISAYYELSSIDHIKDRLIIQNNKAVINQNIEKIVLTGNENWKMGNPNNRYYIDIINQCDLNYNPISTHFDCTDQIDYKKCLLLQNADNNLLRVNIYNDDYVSDVSNFKLWLKEQYDNGIPVTIYYVLKEPYNISLKGTYNIDLLDGINNITTNDLLQPNMKLTTDYVGNIEEYSGSQIQVQNDVQEINEISIIDNYFLYTEYLRTLAIDNIWNKIRGFTYTDCKLTSYTGKPYLKRGNKICVQDNDETYFDTYVLSHTFTYDGTFKSVVESPALSKSQTTMKNNQSVTSYFRKVERICNKIDGKLEDTIEQVNEDGEKISNVTQTVNELNTKIEDNKYYYDEKGNKILISEAVYQLQQTTNGAVSTISTTSGNNIFMNAIGLFGTDYWEGNCKSFTNTELQRQSGQRSCWLLQNTTQKQSVELKNGHYTVSFIYKKIIPLADVKLKINGKSYDLTKTDFTNFSATIEVTDNTLTIEFINDTNGSCYILNLMGNIGDVAQPFSNNPNETVTDTVKIGKGLEIISNTMNTKLKADADGVRVVNSYSDEVTSEFTDKGMSTNDLEAKGISKISGLLITKVNRHVWITGVD